MKTNDDLIRRAEVHAALGDPTRLAIVDELSVSDRSPGELAAHFDVPANLLAHHLDVLEEAGLIERFISRGDRRRRYVRLAGPLPVGGPSRIDLDGRSVLFVCTHNSARSQLAAAMWNDRVPHAPATSAGTEPATRVHPRAIQAAKRRGLDLTTAVPTRAEPAELEQPLAERLVITVCDRAHEELNPSDDWLHWSIDDPVEHDSATAFNRAADDIDTRITHLISQGTSTT
jgi:ArsR family transcriptional regulator, arsenate/arsenite/antimonite-responsive transcriptional repressor / arsenate reductase (thioredoxin)